MAIISKETLLKINCVRAIAGAMCVHFCVGTFFLYGNINDYFAAHLEQTNPDITADDTLIVQPIWLLFQTMITTIGVFLADKFGFKTVTVFALCGFTLVNLATAYVNNYYLYILVYGVGSGCFLGLGYLLSLYIAWTYFPTKKSLITGLCLLATGMCPSIMAPVTSAIANPDNIEDPTDPNYSKNVPLLFQCLAGIFGVITIIVFVVLPSPRLS